MIDILIAVGVALAVSILLTPLLIRLLRPAGLRPGDPRGRPAEPPGQARHPDDGRCRDHGRRSGPGYLGTHLVGPASTASGPSASGLLVLFLATALGVVGFLDDFIKIRRARNLGLNKTAKIVGQTHRRGAVRRSSRCTSATTHGLTPARPTCPTCATSPRPWLRRSSGSFCWSTSSSRPGRTR